MAWLAQQLTLCDLFAQLLPRTIKNLADRCELRVRVYMVEVKIASCSTANALAAKLFYGPHAIVLAPSSQIGIEILAIRLPIPLAIFPKGLFRLIGHETGIIAR